MRPILLAGDRLLAEPECAKVAGSWCQRAYQLTGVDWLSRSAATIMDTALSVLFIVVVAFVLRWLSHRMINHVTLNAVNSGSLALSKVRARRARGAAKSRPEDAVTSERHRARAKTVGSVLRSCASVLIYGVAFVMVLGEFGINLGPILTSVGVVGLAIGFGAQNLVKDFLSGIFMMLEDQYGVGDSVDLGEASGDVEAVGLRTTKLRDIAGTVWYVRNGEILRVGNNSQGYAVAVVDVPVGHGANLAQAVEVCATAAEDAASHDSAADVLERPQVLGVQEITPYAVTLRVTVKTKPGRQWAVQRAVRARLVAALDDADVPMPNAHNAPVTVGSVSA